MISKDNVEEAIKKKLTFTASVELHDRMLNAVLNAQNKSKKTNSAVDRPNLRRKIMKSPITKLAAAAVIITAITLGLFEFINTGSTSGVVWAEVAQKVQGNTGMTYRTKKTQTVTGIGKPIERSEITYYSPKYGMKVEDCPGEEKTITTCFNFTDKTKITLIHNLKKYAQENLPVIPENQGRVIPEEIVKKILSGGYQKLGRQTIENVLAEGIEVDKSSEGTSHSPNDRNVIRLWVSVETGYPVRMETDIVANNGDVHIEMIMDQFHWDVELDESIFKIEIPPDYTPMEMPLP